MRISSITDTNQRDQNEDNRLILPMKVGGKKILLAAVFDGMGGTEAGEEASRMAKERVESWFINNQTLVASANLEKIKDVLTSLLVSLNEEIYNYGLEINKSLGTTSAILMIIGDEYIVSNIGDSRIYKFGSKTLQITKDHTLAQVEVDRGNLTPEEAMTDKRSHTLTQSLGFIDPPDPDYFKGKCKKGDSFLLCSDGMYNRVLIEDMAEVVKDKEWNTKEKLIQIAILSKAEGERDNITGILVEI